MRAKKTIIIKPKCFAAFCQHEIKYVMMMTTTTMMMMIY